MKRITRAFILSVFLLWIGAACTKEKYSNIYATITGTVLDIDTHEPVDSALITLIPGNINLHTKNNGTFQFNNIEAQRYTIQVYKKGYLTDRKPVYAKANDTVNVCLEIQKEQ